MSEDEYIAATDLARLRIAAHILKEASVFQGDGIKEAHRLVYNRMMFLESKELVDAHD